MRTLIKDRRVLAGIVALALASGPGLAHDGPEHEIEELTERMKHGNESAELLVLRAVEFNLLGRTTEATLDLQQALRLDPKSIAAHRELARAYISLSRADDAIEVVERGLKLAREAADRAALLLLRVEVLRERGNYREAVKDANRAVREQPSNVECYLVRSQLQARLGMSRDRLKGLRDGLKRTGSGSLEMEWIDALIDERRFDEALAKIESELKESRLQSTWLIRRAKVRLALKQNTAAVADLEAALAELNERIRPAAPDATLLADRGLTYELLERQEEAQRDFQQAFEGGFDEEWLKSRLKRAP